jgi:hypothetical protein
MKRFQIWIVLIALALLAGCATTVPDYEILLRAEQAAARMSDYETATEPDGEDKLLGNDVSDTRMSTAGTTKQFRLRDLPASDSVSSALSGVTTALSGKHPLMPGVAGDGANGLTVPGAVGLGGSLRFRGAFAVADIPALPVDGDVIMVVDGAAPCDLITGLGPYRYWMAYSGSEWGCLGDGSVGEIDKISSGDSNVTVVDTSTGTISILVDDEVIATFSKQGASVGSMLLSTNLVDNGTYQAAEILTGRVAGEAVSKWQALKLDTSTGKYMLAATPNTLTAPAWGIAVAAADAEVPVLVMTRGVARDDTWNWVPGYQLYLSSTGAGGLTQTAPTTAGHIVQPVGRAISATQVYFNVDFVNGWYTHE